MGILGYGYKAWKGYKKAKATKKMLSGTSTKAERLKYGERGVQGYGIQVLLPCLTRIHDGQRGRTEPTLCAEEQEEHDRNQGDRRGSE